MATSGYCPPFFIFNIHWYRPLSVDIADKPLASFVAPVRRWNDVSIFCNSEVISTSGSVAMLTLTIENVSLIVALGKCCCCEDGI